MHRLSNHCVLDKRPVYWVGGEAILIDEFRSHHTAHSLAKRSCSSLYQRGMLAVSPQRPQLRRWVVITSKLLQWILELRSWNMAVMPEKEKEVCVCLTECKDSKAFGRPQCKRQTALKLSCLSGLLYYVFLCENLFCSFCRRVLVCFICLTASVPLNMTLFIFLLCFFPQQKHSVFCTTISEYLWSFVSLLLWRFVPAAW